MPVRALKYSVPQRRSAYNRYKQRFDAGQITRAVFDERIRNLNDAEEQYRFLQIAREAYEREVRQEQAEQRRVEREQAQVQSRIRGIAQRREQYLKKFKAVRIGTSTRFGRINIFDFAFDPRIQVNFVDSTDRFGNTLVTESETTQKAHDIILDAVNRAYNNGKILISLTAVYRKGTNEATKNFSIGKAIVAPIETGRLSLRIMRGINKAVQQATDSDVIVYLTSFTIKYIDNPTDGACDTNTHHKTYNELKIMSPKSTNSNCLFACIHHHKKERILCDNTRKALGIPLNTPIAIDQIEKIAKHYNVRINLFNLDAKLIGEYNKDSTDVCNIMLFVSDGGRGHYVLIEGETHTCEECGKYWVKKHKCNFRRKMWLNRMSGKRCVIPSKTERDEKFDNNNMLYFDLETFKPDDTDAIIPYAAGWYCEGKYQQAYGENSWNEFIEFIMTQKDKIVCAFNGAGFDFHFLMAELLARGEQIDNVILNNGRLMSFKFGNNLRCWDLCLFTLSSLKDACKSFNVSADNTKTEFDHFKIKSWADVETYRPEVEPYLQRDVLGMKEVFEKFSDMVYDIFKCYMTEFVTLSAMSYAIWTQSVGELIELPDTQKYEFIRSSLYGGRTYPMSREFTSKQYNEIVGCESTEKLKEIYKTMDDWIFNADATSLYPTAMVKFEYPLGNSEWVAGDAVDVNNLKIGIYDVDIEANKSLIVPILPQKTETGGISWNLYDRRGVYTSADLENAIRFGYKITKVHKALVWNKSGDIFSEYILKCYKIKEENDENPVLRQIGKILMNALYGKMLERARFEEQRLCNNIGDVWKFQRDFSITDVQFVKDKVLTIGMPLDDTLSDARIRKPSQVGTFILAYSRRHMLNAMSAIDPTLSTHFFTYTDTDSLHIHADKLPVLEQKGWLSKGLGQLSDDAKGGKIFREINLAPKLYMYLCLMPDGKIKTCMKSKGIPQMYLSPHLFEDADELDDEDKVIVMEHRLKKVGLGKNMRVDWRKYDAFSILSVDMERTFYKNMWRGMDFHENKWYPKK